MYFGFRQQPAEPAATHRLIIIGLFFCMLGDGFIAVSFVAGLSAFLIGHLFYLSGFLKSSSISRRRMAAILPMAFYSFIIGRQLIASLLAEGNDTLVVPVIAYILTIALMAISALLTGNIFAAAGSILFVISDSILSWNMFISSIAFSDVFIMTTYYFAQFLIARVSPSIRTRKYMQQPISKRKNNLNWLFFYIVNLYPHKKEARGPKPSSCFLKI
nr:lysoplasmalogenase [Neobacillus mesonae]